MDDRLAVIRELLTLSLAAQPSGMGSQDRSSNGSEDCFLTLPQDCGD